MCFISSQDRIFVSLRPIISHLRDLIVIHHLRSRLESEEVTSRADTSRDCVAQVALDRQTWTKWWFLWITITAYKERHFLWGSTEHILHAAQNPLGKPVDYQMKSAASLRRPQAFVCRRTQLCTHQRELHLFSITKYFPAATYPRGFSIICYTLNLLFDKLLSSQWWCFSSLSLASTAVTRQRSIWNHNNCLFFLIHKFHSVHEPRATGRLIKARNFFISRHESRIDAWPFKA